MLLLYPSPFLLSPPLYHIFTFHYASTLSLCPRTESREHLIYIPLCFYFILSGWHRSGWHVSFTFHYASTLSVSVYIERVSEWNLHSTMLLLYHVIRDRIPVRDHHLHSTMLLLYHILICDSVYI